MEEIVNKENCTGCSACMNICPKGAIIIVEDNKGFKYPKIDQKKCINCGLCKKTCPVLNSIEEKKNINAYACYNNNSEERKNSSSGGLFILFAKEIIKKGGVVFGASFDEEFMVGHTYAETEEELVKFMGSKYVQSTIGDSYKKAKEFLDAGRNVLFSGTPCQIEGLNSYLKKDYDNLYTLDIVCHGVPAPKVWKKYLDYQSDLYKEKIRNVSFRNKDHGWSLYRTTVLFDTRIYSKEHNRDLFMQAFLNNICLRESCYNCSFKKKYRNSDLTLGDYWGINKVHPELNDNKGTSLLVVNSEKGRELFELIKGEIKCVDTDLDEAIKYNIAYTESVKHNPKEDGFISELDSMSFDKLIYKYVPQPSFIKRCLSFGKRVVKKIIGR